MAATGSKAMLEDGLFSRFARPDFNLAIHGMATLPTGTIGYRSGWAMANVDSVKIIVHGIGGHAAYPQQGKAPVVLAASIIMNLLTMMYPQFQQWRKEGEAGRRKITRWTRYGTVLLASFQALGVVPVMFAMIFTSGFTAFAPCA